MGLLQIQIDKPLQEAIQDRAKRYGVPKSAVVKIALTQVFLENEFSPGNIFNADRDNDGKGVDLDELLTAL